MSSRMAQERHAHPNLMINMCNTRGKGSTWFVTLPCPVTALAQSLLPPSVDLILLHSPIERDICPADPSAFLQMPHAPHTSYFDHQCHNLIHKPEGRMPCECVPRGSGRSTFLARFAPRYRD